MPKIVDHAERRRAIVQAASGILASEGIDGLTMRRLSDAMGVANGALARYFSSKAEIVGAVMQDAIAATIERFEAAGGRGLRGSRALRAFLYEAFPFEDTTRAEARIVIPFYQYAQRDERTAAIYEGWVAEWTLVLTRMIGEMIDEGEARADLDPQRSVDLVFTVIAGAQANPIIAPGWPRARLDALLDSLLHALQ